MDSFLLVVRVILSLAAVFGLLWYLQKRVGRGQGKAGAKLITVVTRQGLGQKASVVVMDTEGTRFVLGVTEQSVTVLHTTDAPEPAEDEEPADGGTAPKPLGHDAMAGSIFSPDTWKQAAEALRGGRKH